MRRPARLLLLSVFAFLFALPAAARAATVDAQALGNTITFNAAAR